MVVYMIDDKRRLHMKRLTQGAEYKKYKDLYVCPLHKSSLTKHSKSYRKKRVSSCLVWDTTRPENKCEAKRCLISLV